jgi:hypothetical protein
MLMIKNKAQSESRLIGRPFKVILSLQGRAVGGVTMHRLSSN